MCIERNLIPPLHCARDKDDEAFTGVRHLAEQWLPVKRPLPVVDAILEPINSTERLFDGDDKGEGIGMDLQSDAPTQTPRKPGRTRSPIPKDAAREARDERI